MSWKKYPWGICKDALLILDREGYLLQLADQNLHVRAGLGSFHQQWLSHKWILSLNSHSTRIRFPEVSTNSETPTSLLIVHELTPILLMSLQKVPETPEVWRKSVKYVGFLKIRMRTRWPLCREGDQKPSVSSKLPGFKQELCLEASSRQKWGPHPNWTPEEKSVTMLLNCTTINVSLRKCVATPQLWWDTTHFKQNLESVFWKSERQQCYNTQKFIFFFPEGKI